MAKKRRMRPIRFKVLRVDGSIQTAQRTIQAKFGLPNGSVKLVYPSGRKAKKDGTVGALIKYWEKHG